MPKYRQIGRPLVLSTPLPPDTLLCTGLSASEGISKLFEYQITSKALRGTPVPFEDLLGQPALVRFTSPGRPDRLFHGMVREVRQGSTDREFTHYKLTVAPRHWLLTQRVRSRVFARQSVPDILKKVFAGFDVAHECGDGFRPRDYCVQYRESDFAFASRLMEEEGIFYYFKPAEDGHKLVLSNTPVAHPDLGIIKFRADLSSDEWTDEFLAELDKVQRITPLKVQVRDHNFQLPHDRLIAESVMNPEVEVGLVQHTHRPADPNLLEVYEYPGRYAWRFDGVEENGGEQAKQLTHLHDDNKRVARIRQQEATAKAVELRGRGTVRTLLAGHGITINATDRAAREQNLDGKYTITTIEQDIKADGNFRSGESDQYEYENRLTLIPQKLPYRPARLTPRPEIAGTQTAVVVGPPDEEIFTDKFGRVKVLFHWDREGKGQGENSCWVRVATPHAGKGFGGICIPRVGEEVVVTFVDGDPDRPLIVGRVYNPREAPPFDLPAKKMQSGMKSNTYPGGGGDNEISMDDSKGSERMYLHAQYNQDTVVGNNRTAQVGVDDFEKVGGKQIVVVGSDQVYNIGANQKVDIAANQLITIGANQKTVVGQNILVQAGTSITFQCGAAMIHMNQAGVISIAGTIVSMGGSIMANVAAPVTTVDGVLTMINGVVNMSNAVVNKINGSVVTVEGKPVKINT
jgi:type VI secretion system secreted protein VgrG